MEPQIQDHFQQMQAHFPQIQAHIHQLQAPTGIESGLVERKNLPACWPLVLFYRKEILEHSAFSFDIKLQRISA